MLSDTYLTLNNDKVSFFTSVNHCVELVLGSSFQRTVLTEKLGVVNENVYPTAIASTIANFASATAIVECLALGDKKQTKFLL